MNFSEFTVKFNKIRSSGYIKSHRKGNTGAGHTFEQEMGLTENNISLPDLINFLTELKTKRINSNSLLTLLTNDTGWQLPQIDLIEQYGWNHRNHPGAKTVQATIKTKLNKRGFHLDVTDTDYLLVCKNGTPFIKWEWNNILDHCITKFENLIVVDVAVKKQQDVEYFHFNGFNYYRGTSKQMFRSMIENNKIGVDLRLYTQYNLGKGVRNRGTALRIKHNDVKNLYTSQEYFG